MEKSNPVPDYLRVGLKVLFVGFNPSVRSGETGHHYANPNNRFWNILFRAGLTPRKYSPDEDSRLLELGYGLTNIVERPTPAAADITPDEYVQGRETLGRKIIHYQPRVVCYVGKGVYDEYRKFTSSPYLADYLAKTGVTHNRLKPPPYGEEDSSGKAHQQDFSRLPGRKGTQGSSAIYKSCPSCERDLRRPSVMKNASRTKRRDRVAWGIQEEPVIPGIVDFVAPSSSGLVRMGMDQVVAIYRQLAELISSLR